MALIKTYRLQITQCAGLVIFSFNNWPHQLFQMLSEYRRQQVDGKNDMQDL